MRRLLGLLRLLVCACPLFAATPVEKRLDTYLRLARASVARLPAAAPGAPDHLRPELYGPVLERLALQSSVLELEAARSVVLQMSVLLPADEKLRRAGEALVDALQKEREAARARHRAEVDALLAKSAKACLAATTPADLDATLRELAPYRGGGEDPRRRSTFDHADRLRALQMFQFVSRWQDLLAARAAQDSERVRSLLSELRNLVDPALIPRSRLLDSEQAQQVRRSAAPAKPAAPAAPPAPPQAKPETTLARLASVENLEQFAALAPELAGIASTSPVHAAIHESAGRIQLSKIELERGHIAASPFLSETRKDFDLLLPPDLIPVFQKLHAELRVLSLRSVFRDSGLPPLPNEPTDVYVLRVAQAAVKAENWEYALRTLEFYRALFPAGAAPAWVERELETCLAYVAARHLDEARQAPQAILAYQESLGLGGSLTPVKLVADRLAAFRAESPGAFAEAAGLPRDQRVGERRVDRGGYPSRMQQPGMQPTFLVPRSERPLGR